MMSSRWIVTVFCLVKILEVVVSSHLEGISLEAGGREGSKNT